MSTPTWGTLRDGLQSWIEGLAGASVGVTWEETPRKVYVGPHVLLSLGAHSPYGTAEVNWTYDGGSDELQPTVTGYRAVTLTLRVRSYDQTPGDSAIQTAEDLRLRLGRPTSHETLNALGVALVRSDELLEASYIHDNRRISQVNLGLRLAYRVDEQDTTSAGDYFNRVDLSGEADPGDHVIEEETIGPPP